MHGAERPRGVATTARGRDTRQRIVDAASDLVFAYNVAALNLDDVLQATGTSKSQLYHYFTDRSDLVRAVVARQGERVLEIHRNALSGAEGWEALRRWRDLVVSITQTRGGRGGCPIGSLSSELAQLDAVARVELVGVFDRWQQLLADVIRTMISRGELRADADADELALSMITSLQGGLLLAKTLEDPRPVEVALDTALGYVETFKAPAGRKRTAPR
jgi:TetR/AcrR family transcriptional regulator, transcriptional repressor for nem operon